MKTRLLKSLMAGAAIMVAGSAAAANQIYLVGAPQGWDIDNASMPLPEVTSGIYQASFDIAASDFMFRFYTELGNWEANSLGSQVDDQPIMISLVDDLYYVAHYVAGKGSWSNPDWEGGTLYITVDTNTKSVVFTTDPDANVPDLMPDLYIVGNNINGEQNWDAGELLTYDYTNDYYTWSGNSLGSGFKFNDGGWDGDYNIGSNGSPLQEGVIYKYYNGGDSGNIVFENDAIVINNPSVILDTKTGTLTVTGNSEEQEITLTLAGTMNEWYASDPDFTFTKNSDGLFTLTAFMYADSEFQVVMLGNQWLGCEPDMGEISFSESSSVTRNLAKGYENNFVLTNWEGGNITFTVNLDAMTITMASGDGGVATIGSDTKGAESIYNLQGVKINGDDLKPGIYIVNGKKIVKQ